MKVWHKVMETSLVVVMWVMYMVKDISTKPAVRPIRVLLTTTIITMKMEN